MPSRVNSYFLNTHRDVAERRAVLWNCEDRALVRCHILTTTGNLHCGLVSNYEAVVKDPKSQELADAYWQDSPAIVTEDNRHDVELLADCGLYFPDWASFVAQKAYQDLWGRLGRP